MNKYIININANKSILKKRTRHKPVGGNCPAMDYEDHNGSIMKTICVLISLCNTHAYSKTITAQSNYSLLLSLIHCTTLLVGIT